MLFLIYLSELIDIEIIILTKTGIILHHEQHSNISVVAVSDEHLARREAAPIIVRPQHQARVCAVSVVLFGWHPATQHTPSQMRGRWWEL